MKQLKMMENMNYKVGDEVLVKSLDWYYQNRDRMEQVDCGNACFIRSMTTLCEKKVTISSVLPTLEVYHIKEDDGTFNWTDEMFEGLVEEETYDFLKTDKSNLPSLNDFMDMLNNEIKLPDGYIFKDENGNIINATKIVMEKKKKEYPKTYEECAEALSNRAVFRNFRNNLGHKGEILYTLQKLLVCRDAYWKIAGEEMGLSKPWAPDWENSEERRYSIVNIEGDINLPETTLTKWILKVTNKILVFPTEEMRDAFYDNFKKEIEICKELL